jgi:hypothetical protein
VYIYILLLISFKNLQLFFYFAFSIQDELSIFPGQIVLLTVSKKFVMFCNPCLQSTYSFLLPLLKEHTCQFINYLSPPPHPLSSCVNSVLAIFVYGKIGDCNFSDTFYFDIIKSNLRETYFLIIRSRHQTYSECNL